ncbi:2-succinyl-6-hydroxy-2,4-cyclohexadiene-1-carboxylate synthase [Bombilactobacillus folatiphilus]|uniref:Putative 2-succinyl-6-hydroxy-2,4-cyclohexadiene-1-carboxylate synthase n=1 Tax=Bombilactobacillus folatiphilus TaxID=2923362 RepID=A0ABY4P7X6_9LACO|nr:2-succinyl-6-hydroxy-2,4-cyclohexadiene-1-carboxylate synthase [Bombilactobacillus folatiphilus]UQS81799.1 2-succinyl-6-hydroxy-2,4-cyclohexadiene-1-carboxylate synthase [Bombilactobacillus folatiphilus]
MQVKIGKHTFFVQKSGQGQPHWVFWHGFMGSGHDFAQISEKLPGTCWTVDLLGHGQTNKVASAAPYQMAQQIAQLAALLQTLVGTQAINLVGYSMGGRLALGYALMYPEHIENLILESSTAGLKTPQQRQQRQQHDALLAQKLRTEPLVQFVDAWEQLPLFESQKQLPTQLQVRIRQQRLAQDPLALAASLEGMGTGTMPNFWPRLQNLRVPVTLIAGQKDVKFQRLTAQMAHQLPIVQRLVVANAGHNVHLEQPQIYQMILERLVHAN